MTRAYVFAGGGTGGHIFPALAIAERVRALDADARCVFVCSERKLDAEILGKEGVEFCAVPAQPLGLRPRALWRFAMGWGPAVREGRELIRALAASGAKVKVVAMGGFVAAPIVQAARAERTPVLMVNMDAVPGKANRWIARKADRIVTSAPVPGSEAGGWERVPPIVRAKALTGKSRDECRAALGLKAGVKTLMVTGGSQGARSVNTLVTHVAGRHPDAMRGWQVVHQTGAGEDAAVREAYEAAGVHAVVRPFFDGMGLAWGSADLAVSRAGAGSVAEAWANGVPTLFLPYPYHKDEHQKFNAAPLVEAGAAVIEKDLITPEANAPGAGARLIELMSDDSRRGAMAAALKALGPADGAERIARLLVE